VGFNPYRKKVVRRGDVVLLAVGVVIALAALAWAIFG
jgi:large-conductance mechanosensitive channel